MSKEKPIKRLRTTAERILTKVEEQLDSGEFNQTLLKAITECRKIIELLDSQGKLKDAKEYTKDELTDLIISALVDAKVPDEYLKRFSEECRKRGL